MPNLLQFRTALDEEPVNLFKGVPYAEEFYNPEVDKPQYLLPTRQEEGAPLAPISEYDVPPNPLENIQAARYAKKPVQNDRDPVPVAPRAVSVPKQTEEEAPWYSKLGQGAMSIISHPDSPLQYFYDSNTPYGQMMDRYHQYGTQKMNARAAMTNALKQKSELGNVGQTIRDMSSAGYTEQEITDYLMKSGGGVNVSLGEKTTDKVAGERIQKQINAIDVAANQYLGMRGSLDSLEERLASGQLRTGGGTIGELFAEVGVDLGLTDAQKARDVEDFRIVFGQQMGKILDSLNVGAISDSERTMFKKLAVSFGKSPEANLQLVRALRLAGELALDTQRYYNSIAEGNYSAATQKRMIDEYVRKRSKESNKRISALSSQSQVARESEYKNMIHVDPTTGAVYKLKPKG